MAAYSACMCLMRRCHLLRKSVSFVPLQNSQRQCLHSELVRRRIVPTQSTFVLLYSSHKSDNVKGLTDDILKAKIRAEKSKDKGSGGDKTKSEQSKEGESKNTTFKARWTGKNAWKLGLVFLGGWALMSIGGLVYIWGSPPRDPDGNIVNDEFSEFATLQAYIKRASREFTAFRKTIQDPSREKLLPDPLEAPYLQPPYTLVLEMTDVLVHPEWTYGTGWRFKKRPCVEYFLQQVGPPLFELVIYTSEQGMTADPLITSLDTQGYVMYRLYRDATRYVDGHHIKDLSCLNRDLSKVIFIDWNKQSYQFHPRNAFPLKRWTGGDDRTLVDLAHFLKTVASSNVDDVRPVLEYYSQFDDPLETFKENQKKLQLEQERLTKFQQDQVKKQSGSWSLNPFRR